MKHFISAIAILLICVSFTADGWKALFTIKTRSDFFTSDNIGNIYTVKADEIRKYNTNGDLLKIYSNKKLGKITSVDASNPLRVLVFYKDFAKVVLLDSQLSENGEGIALEQLSLEQSDLASTSFNNGLWFYNRQNAELVRLDESLNKIVSTGNLNRILGTELHPNYLLEYNGYVYLNNPADGILVFDIYGTYYKTITLKNLRSFQLKDEEIFYYKDKQLNAYQTKLLSEYKMPVPDTSIANARVDKGRFYFEYADSLTVKEFSK
ncbi:MAG: hypothetical protein ACJ76F_00240 [Bacteroidia bacterium]